MKLHAATSALYTSIASSESILYKVVKDPSLEFIGMPPMTSRCSGSNEYAKSMTSFFSANTLAEFIMSLQNL
jgi:redox-regulated HSP33 family molecular chaperone